MLKQIKLRYSLLNLESMIFINRSHYCRHYSTQKRLYDKRHQDNSASAQLLRNAEKMSPNQYNENLDQILSSLTKQFYKNKSTNKYDIQNIHQILDIAKNLQYHTNSSKISNLAEVASYFNYNSKEFWRKIENRVMKFYKLTIMEISQLIRAGSYISIAFSIQTWQHLKSQLYDQLDLVEVLQAKDLSKYIVKCIHGLDKANQIDYQILKQVDKFSESRYHEFETQGICMLAHIYSKNGYHAKNFFQFLETYFSNKSNLLLLKHDIVNSTLLINSYRGLHQIRGLTNKEYQICQNLEDIIMTTLKSASSKQIYLQDLSLFVYSLGMINIGFQETWDYLQTIILEKFENMNKADFDMILAGLMTTTQFQCSLQLQRILEECIMQNYEDDLEEFCMAANLIGKQSGRGNKKFWDTCLKKMIQYIQDNNSSPKVMTVYLKLVAKFRKQDVKEDQCRLVTKYILQNLDRFNNRDLASVIHSVCQIKNLNVQEVQILFQRGIEKSNEMGIKELFELVLANTYQQQIFNEDNLNNLFNLLATKIEQLSLQQQKDRNTQGLKQIQALVLHLSIYNLGNQQIWDALVDIYESTYLKFVNIEQQYHLTSLLGLMIKSSYDNNNSDLQNKIDHLINQYQNIIKDNCRNLSKNAFENIKQIEKTFIEQQELQNKQLSQSKDILNRFQNEVLSHIEKSSQKQQIV